MTDVTGAVKNEREIGLVIDIGGEEYVVVGALSAQKVFGITVEVRSVEGHQSRFDSQPVSVWEVTLQLEQVELKGPHAYSPSIFGALMGHKKLEAQVYKVGS